MDGTMTASMAHSLLKAGIGFESTLRMINSAMLAKGGEESLATLDIACIDLFTGETQLRKAGAAGTVLRRRTKAEYLEAKSVPVGILPEIRFAPQRKASGIRRSARHGFGRRDRGGHRVALRPRLEFCGRRDPQVLAEQIVDRAVHDRADGHEDDVSAMVLRIQ